MGRHGHQQPSRFGAESVSRELLGGQADLDKLEPESVADHWNLALLLLRVDAVIRQAVDSLELSAVAKHAYGLAQTFNSFYHRYPVAQESDDLVRSTRTGIVRLYHDGMVRLLDTMGITVPDRM